MSTLLIKQAEVFRPLDQPARYKGAYGGRGSGKSHDRAGALIEDSLYERGLLSVCIREVQKSLKDSAKRLLETKLQEFGLGEADGFKVFTDRLQTPGDGVIIFQGMQDHTAESIKSLEGFKRAWVEEAQTLSSTSLNLLRPTIRAPGSELWFTWNPRLKTDAVDVMFRAGNKPTGAVVVKANWNDNPWFPKELAQERLDCLEQQSDQYNHIWEGDYISVSEGAYYASDLAQARAQERITQLSSDPLMPVKAYWDIGVRDACSIWVAQQRGTRLNVLKYYEAVGQPLGAHLEWLRKYGYDKALCVLPHDGGNLSPISARTFADHIRDAGFDVKVVENQGKGAAMRRVEAARRVFPSIWFDDEGCAAGLDALGWYHERKDEHRNIGLGPEHDWASHGADAFGLMCVDYEEPIAKRQNTARRQYVGAGGWLG